MMRPVPMKKVTVVLLDEKKDDVLRELKEIGAIQLLDVPDSPDLRDFELAPVPLSWVRAKASEFLSRVDNVLDIFQLVDLEKKSPLKGLIQEEVEREPVSEIPASELFEDIEDRISAIENKVLQISSRLENLKKEKEELANSKGLISILQKLGIDPKDLGEYRSVRVEVGVVPSKEIENLKREIGEIDTDFLVYCDELNKKESVVLLVFFKEREVEVTKILRMHRFEELQIPIDLCDLGLKEASSKIESELTSLTKEKKKLLEELEKIAVAEKNNFFRMKELLQVEKYLEEANTLFGKTTKTYVLSGWVPMNRVEEIGKVIQKSSDGYCTISIEDPKKDEEPPTLLSNPSPAKPAELFIDTYGSPSYREIDPTDVMAITFPVTFGLMFGDVGHGATLALIGYILGFHLRVDKAIKRFGRILLLSGIAATFCGFLYGGIFGLEILHPLWLRPLENISTFITFALVLGLIQLSLGCLLNIVNHVSHRKYLEAVFSPLGVMGLWILWGGASLVMKHGVDIFALAGDIKTICVAILIPFTLIALAVKYVDKHSIFWGFYEAYDNLTRFLFNSISYIRVIVIAVVHAALCMMMTTIMAMFPATALGFALKSVIFLIGNLIIFVMEAFISFVQTLRLHYYELFSKFYEGHGSKFSPFKIMRKYTFLAPTS